jgi:hypothetical protein
MTEHSTRKMSKLVFKSLTMSSFNGILFESLWFLLVIRLYDKNSESDYYFFPPPKSEYFFQQHWESEYFFRKNHNLPLQVKWSFPYHIYLNVIINNLLYQPAWTILVKLGEINMTSTPLIILNKTQKFYYRVKY